MKSQGRVGEGAAPEGGDVNLTVRRLPYDEREGADVWPNGATLAVLVYSAPEEWMWDRNETRLPPGTLNFPDEARPSLSTRSAVNYGFEIGLRRLRDLLQQHGLKVTLWVTANAAEQHPEIIREMADVGHEIGAHAYSEGTFMSLLTRDEQAETIATSLQVLESVTAQRPTGWVSPGAVANEDTVDLLADAKLSYHGDLQDDELPYFIDTPHGTLVEIPYRYVGNLNDLPLFVRSIRSAEDGLTFLTSSFDAYFKESKRRPLLFNFGSHPYIIGRPDYADMMSRFLEHVQSHDEHVWLCTYQEIAEWWVKRFANGY